MIPRLLILISLSTVCIQAAAQSLWTVGPMLHVNFGGPKRSVSFALEAAYWNVDNVPYSVDFGIEFDRQRTRFYSELQTGIGVTGISAGPVFQVGQGGAKLGLQASCWINYYVGLDYRMRFLKDEKVKSIGTYLKLPVSTSGLDSDGGDFDWDSDWD